MDAIGQNTLQHLSNIRESQSSATSGSGDQRQVKENEVAKAQSIILLLLQTSSLALGDLM